MFGLISKISLGMVKLYIEDNLFINILNFRKGIMQLSRNIIDIQSGEILKDEVNRTAKNSLGQEGVTCKQDFPLSNFLL